MMPLVIHAAQSLLVRLGFISTVGLISPTTLRKFWTADTCPESLQSSHLPAFAALNTALTMCCNTHLTIIILSSTDLNLDNEQSGETCKYVDRSVLPDPACLHPGMLEGQNMYSAGYWLVWRQESHLEKS